MGSLRGGGRTQAADVITGTLDKVVYANPENGWSVLRLRVPGRREPVTVVGSLLGVQPGERLRLTGRWILDPKYGEQFRAEAFTSLQPSTATGIERYLGSGLVHGVGPRTAARLVARFGLETLDIIERAPERLVEVEGIGPVRAAAIQSAWAEQKTIREVMVFLQGHGLSPALAVRIYRRYRDLAVQVVREDPFRLAEDVSGIGFRTADRLAAQLGLAADAPARIRAGIVYALNRFADQGHVHARRPALVEAATATLAEAASGKSAEAGAGPEGEGGPEAPDVDGNRGPDAAAPATGGGVAAESGGAGGAAPSHGRGTTWAGPDGRGSAAAGEARHARGRPPDGPRATDPAAGAGSGPEGSMAAAGAAEVAAQGADGHRGQAAAVADRVPAPVPAVAVAAQLDALVREDRLTETRTDPESDPWLALPALDAAERGVVSGLLRLLRSPIRPLVVDVPRALAWYEGRVGVQLAPLQRQAVEAAVRDKVLVVTGGPGTGKTTLLRAIVDIHSRKERRIALCAPTGRAAQRLGEATGQQAKTIHRLLEFDPKAGRFQRDEQRPLEADLVVADEASMIDVVLMNSLCKAVPSSAQLLLVGDADQLPSVGPGNVLHDVIASGAVPVIRLTEVFRQAQESRIVRSAHRIHAGQFPTAEGGRDDFFWIAQDDPEKILGLCKRLVTKDIPRRFGLDPVADVQVLTPMRRGLLGAGNLNLELQALLNPAGAAIRGGRGLRVGDKVMQVENDYERDVFNGDLGQVARADDEEGTVTVRFGAREVQYDSRDLDELQLAYACSVHKAQGSEYPAVVIPLHTQHYLLLQRRLLYTAVTRGRQLVVLVGSPRALGIAVRDRKAAPRNTQLTERLRRAAAGAERMGQ